MVIGQLTITYLMKKCIGDTFIYFFLALQNADTRGNEENLGLERYAFTLGPVHMAVGDAGMVRYPIHPRSEKPGVHMRPRGAGVRFKMLLRGRLSTYIDKEFSDNCPDEQHPIPPPAFTWRKLTPAKRVTRLG